MTPAEANRQHEEAGLRVGVGGKDAVGQVTPAEVFLQLYHTHPLITESQDLPLHVPNNQVGGTGLQAWYISANSRNSAKSAKSYIYKKKI